MNPYVEGNREGSENEPDELFDEDSSEDEASDTNDVSFSSFDELYTNCYIDRYFPLAQAERCLTL